jgi:hypothetical protein
MSRRNEWEVENVRLLTASLNHRLKVLRKIRKPLRRFDRTVRAIQLTKVAWNCPDDAFLMMNFDMNPLGEINCSDEYARTTKRRDRLWEFLLGAK